MRFNISQRTFEKTLIIIFIAFHFILIYKSIKTNAFNSNENNKIKIKTNFNKNIENITNKYNQSKINIFNAKIAFLAGKNSFGFADGTNVNASFGHILGIAVDKNENIYLSDTDNGTIRKITANGYVSNILYNNQFESNSSNEKKLCDPLGIVIDKDGNIIVAEYSDHKISKIDTKGHIVTIAGSGIDGYKNGFGKEAEFCNPRSLAMDKKGNIYVADEYNHSIRKISPDNIVSTLAGTKTKGLMDGASTMAAFNRPYSIACDKDDNLYVADFANDKIRKINQFGNVTTIALKYRAGSKKYAIKSPQSLAIDNENNIFVADNSEDRLKVIDREGYISAVSLRAYDSHSDAELSGDITIAFSKNGELLISDMNKPQIRKIIFDSAMVNTL